MSNKIELKSINELFGMNFYIPAYQRGYRWNIQQVKDLLEDIQIGITVFSYLYKYLYKYFTLSVKPTLYPKTHFLLLLGIKYESNNNGYPRNKEIKRYIISV